MRSGLPSSLSPGRTTSNWWMASVRLYGDGGGGIQAAARRRLQEAGACEARSGGGPGTGRPARAVAATTLQSFTMAALARTRSGVRAGREM